MTGKFYFKLKENKKKPYKRKNKRKKKKKKNLEEDKTLSLFGNVRCPSSVPAETW